MTKPVVELGWGNEQVFQQLLIRITNWSHQTFVGSYKSHDTSFRFEGVVMQGYGGVGFEDRKVLGDIQVPTGLLYPSEHEPVPGHHGDFNVTDDFISVDLLVGPKTLKEMYRVFSVAFGNNGGLLLHVMLTHEKQDEPDFWRERWRDESVQIAEFRLNAVGQLREIQRPTRWWW